MVVTTNGKNDVVNNLTNYISSNYVYFGVGTGTTAANTSDTDLESPVEVTYGSGVYRKKVDNVYFDGSNMVFVCRIGSSEFNVPGQTINISEIGIFNSESGGIMLTRELLSDTLPKDLNKEYVVEVKVGIFG